MLTSLKMSTYEVGCAGTVRYQLWEQVTKQTGLPWVWNPIQVSVSRVVDSSVCEAVHELLLPETS